jgi:hypothetical protein
MQYFSDRKLGTTFFSARATFENEVCLQALSQVPDLKNKEVKKLNRCHSAYSLGQTNS